MRLAPVAAVLITALALYVSRGVLDQLFTASGPVRVALLPPWQTLGGFLALAALGLLWLDRRAVPRGTATAVRPPLGPLVLPALGLSVLLLPYLPVVADVMPALQMLAGPLRGIVWLAIIAQLVWVLWQVRFVGAGAVLRWTVWRLAGLVALATTLVSGAAASRLTGTVLYPAGDEPHYLVIAQSLWRDGDLQIENNHQRRDYGEYYALDLEPHYVTRGADGEIYSIHPVGLPVLLAPIYAAGGYRLVVLAMVLMAGLAAGLMWLAVVAVTNAAGAATFAWAAIVLTTPFLYNSFSVYPEIAAGLAAVVAWTRARAAAAGGRWPRWLPVGVACAALPWLSTKYAPMSAALVLVAVARVVAPERGAASRMPAFFASARASLRTVAPALAAILGPYVVSLAAWFAFFALIWGTPLPQAPYGDLVQTRPFNLIVGAPGLLFDQEYGLLPYAPVYVLAATGLWAMWREGGELRRSAIEIGVTFAALLGTVGAFRIWWGGSASPGRPLVSGLLLLALPIAVAFRSAPAGSARRAAQHLLLWLSIGIAGVLLFAQNGFLTANGRDGTSSLLEFLSPQWPAWTTAPSFIYHEAPTALAHAAAWLLLAALAAWRLARISTPHPGVASLAAIGVGSAALAAGALVVPALPAEPAWPGIDLRARARLAVLDRFDTVARPVAVEYDPIRLTHASTVAAHAVLEVVPGSRSEPQPIRVLHNGRVSLPAGVYRVEVEWGAARDGETIGLQIGRTGDPWREWAVTPRPGERWSAEFTIPLDASFVGLRGSAELERAIARLTFTPLQIVDAASRPRAPTIIGASASGPGSFFYYDGNAFPEAAGFWVRGGRTTRVTVFRPAADGPIVLRVHSGPIANRLQLSTAGWSETRALSPEQPEEIEIPASGRALVTLELGAERAFVPQERDVASADARPLGTWVELVR